MSSKMPRTPFSTRLSGSAKETELRIRNIFQWKKKRPPVVLILLVALAVLLCFGLVSCRVTEQPPAANSTQLGEAPAVDVTTEEDANKEGPQISTQFTWEDFFAGYVTVFPEYTYTGVHSATIVGRMIELEDTPENCAEEAVLNFDYFSFIGDAAASAALTGRENLVSGSNEFARLTVHTLSVMSEQDFQPNGAYFTEALLSEGFVDALWTSAQECGLTEYTVVYEDKSWEWTQEALGKIPQLDNGRYERLYLLGRSEADPDWKIYACFWGEYIFGATPAYRDFLLQKQENGIGLGTGEYTLPEMAEKNEEVITLDARSAYAKALEELINDCVLPDGNRAGLTGDMSENMFAVCDVDGDGREELLLMYTTTYTAGHVGFVFDFDETTQMMRTQFLEYPMLTFYENGAVKAGLSHNQGWAGSFWPYYLYQYQPSTDSYQSVGMVDAWDKKISDANPGFPPFPSEIDISDTGFVYYIYNTEDGEYDDSDPVDASVYHAWLEQYIGDASEIDIPYLALTVENIQTLRSQ